MLHAWLHAQPVPLMQRSNRFSVFTQNFNEEEQALAREYKYNFDHPDAFDYDLLIETLKRLKEGKSVDIPIYNFVHHRREKETVCSMEIK